MRKRTFWVKRLDLLSAHREEILVLYTTEFHCHFQCCRIILICIEERMEFSNELALHSHRVSFFHTLEGVVADRKPFKMNPSTREIERP